MRTKKVYIEDPVKKYLYDRLDSNGGNPVIYEGKEGLEILWSRLTECRWKSNRFIGWWMKWMQWWYCNDYERINKFIRRHCEYDIQLDISYSSGFKGYELNSPMYSRECAETILKDDDIPFGGYDMYESLYYLLEFKKFVLKVIGMGWMQEEQTKEVVKSAWILIHGMFHVNADEDDLRINISGINLEFKIRDLPYRIDYKDTNYQTRLYRFTVIDTKEEKANE